jgi:hypothetical protein
MNKLLIVALVAGMLLGAVTAASLAEAKKYDVRVKVHFEKLCGDKLYLRMADNTRDPVTGQHKGLIWKTKYFVATKTDYNYKVSVDTKKVPSGRIVTYDEIIRNGEEIHDEYQHKTLKKYLLFNFNIPALC